MCHCLFDDPILNLLFFLDQCIFRRVGRLQLPQPGLEEEEEPKPQIKRLNQGDLTTASHHRASIHATDKKCPVLNAV